MAVVKKKKSKVAVAKPKKSKLAVIKTKQTKESVIDFIKKVPDAEKQKDSMQILDMMKKATKQEPRMWGSSLIGFGEVRYKSPTSGREVDWFRIGFSPRKANLSIFLTMDVNKNFGAALKKLGKCKTGKGCLYINRLSEIDMDVLKEMIQDAAKLKG